MSLGETLTVESDGKIRLPVAMREKFGFSVDSKVRAVETPNGVLLVSLANEPLSADLQAELDDWQSLSLASWEMFPYEEERL